MKIKKVDDKPMVIHTKEKAKIHAHEPKGAKIKGSNIYTVERGPKTIGASNGRYKNISHVAVYVGNGKVVEALNESLGVVYRDVASTGKIVVIGRP